MGQAKMPLGIQMSVDHGYPCAVAEDESLGKGRKRQTQPPSTVYTLLKAYSL